jgi:hypothetical protein
MGSIYTKVIIKDALIRKGVLIKAEVAITKAEFLRLYSKIARKESDEEMQQFFDAFKL